MRDMRDALGALGPVDGQNPELNNLTVSMTVAQRGDILFLTSDGISDNFDPVVGNRSTPAHALTLLRMQDLLQQGLYQGDGPVRSAEELCDRMVDFATKLTAAKRRILEDPDLYSDGSQGEEARKRRHRAGPRLAMVPGKLDHASLVAYQIGGSSKRHDSYDGHDRTNRNVPAEEPSCPDNYPFETTI
ncbi:hypothetical protein IscW_ISCW008157 [Ixodes scapularis]|uniref:Uncharacterized protein n=1 Tax=Ixodes scapularis TaxID=6945 RepID=B7PS68_IXOSC|nr:hypothetical protein IscW_ISCW008157 [Ixodes scapularis]|eukprot:XP_002402055.1 hypothetical protein IscW_ISCW008157 [Ixodes scapularis]